LCTDFASTDDDYQSECKEHGFVLSNFSSGSTLSLAQLTVLIDALKKGDLEFPNPDNNNGPTNEIEFNNWVGQGRPADHPHQLCTLDVRNYWLNRHILWAGHDCAFHDVTIKVQIPEDKWNTKREWTSKDAIIDKEECDQGICTVFFIITPTNPNLGVAFTGEQGKSLNFPWETVEWRLSAPATSG